MTPRHPALVTDPAGMDWTVQIVWQPRWDALSRRFGGWRRKRAGRRAEFDGLDWVDVPVSSAGSSSSGGGGGFWDDLGDDLVVAVLVVVAVIVAGALFWWLLLPLLLLVVDGLVVLALVVAGTVARVALGRPWTVRATPRRGAAVEQQVHGWGNARRRQRALREALRTGVPLDAVATADASTAS